jgi:hypothetical protein
MQRRYFITEMQVSLDVGRSSEMYAELEGLAEHPESLQNLTLVPETGHAMAPPANNCTKAQVVFILPIIWERSRNERPSRWREQ